MTNEQLAELLQQQQQLTNDMNTLANDFRKANISGIRAHDKNPTDHDLTERISQIDPKSYSASEKFYQDRQQMILRHAEVRERPENVNERHEATLQFRVNEITAKDTLNARAEETQANIKARMERLRPSVKQGESEEEFRAYARGVFQKDRQ